VTKFAACLTEVLKFEGGYSNHPSDHGGATMRGVTQAVYDEFRQRAGQLTRSVRLVDDVELEAIYRRGYWDPVHGDDLPDGLDLVTFDTAVNSGPRRAVELLQRALKIPVDGLYGPGTTAAVAACKPLATVEAYVGARLGFYLRLVRKNPSQRVFLKGWMNRLRAVKQLARTRAGAVTV
jgi:lysozyme family protein